MCRRYVDAINIFTQLLSARNKGHVTRSYQVPAYLAALVLHGA